MNGFQLGRKAFHGLVSFLRSFTVGRSRTMDVTIDESEQVVIGRSPEATAVNGSVRAVDANRLWICAHLEGLEVELDIQGLKRLDILKDLLPGEEWDAVIHGLETAIERFEENAKSLSDDDAKGSKQLAAVRMTMTGQAERTRAIVRKMRDWFEDDPGASQE